MEKKRKGNAMTRTIGTGAIALLLAATFSFTSCKKEEVAAPVNVPVASSPAADLKTNMRKLWEDHVTWTRNVILNIMDDLGGTNEAVARLQKNQDDIGDAIKPYYGDAAGEKLSTLLHDHISIAAELLTAAKQGNTTGFDEANKKWSDNADSIAAFLSTANPSNWPEADMKTMLHDHLKLTTDEAVARLNKDYAGDVAAYDKVHDEILKMADMLTDGIVKQFPSKF
jgi:hypothetical protein